MPQIEKIIPNLYRDSVALMQLSARMASQPGIASATAIMATPANIALLSEANLLTRPVAPRPNDLLVVIEGADEAAVAGALRLIEALEEAPAPAGGAAPLPPSSLAMGREDLPGANLALVSTPGEYAAAEAEKALRLGLNVMLFSDRVEIEDEIALKREACERGLMVMGPDCGTAIIDGVPLGFANVVRRGPVGAVGASGTGLQAVTCLIDRAGVGISQAIGTGSRDLHERVGGITMLAGLAALAKDAATRVIVLISKPPSPEVAAKICRAAEAAGKPVVVNFLGADAAAVGPGLHPAETLEDAARAAVALALGRPEVPREDPLAHARQAHALAPGQKYIRGLFSGGTFCYEAQLVLEAIGPVWSNTPIDPAYALADAWTSRAHTVVDLGDDVFTRGRPHPMIDQRLRLERLAKEAADPETAVILFDVVLGHGAHKDPAAEIAAAIAATRSEHRPVFVGSVCGTSADPQNLERQEAILHDAGVLLAPSSTAAARLAAQLVTEFRGRA